MVRKRIWQLKRGDNCIIGSLVESLGISKTLATILVNRGLITSQMVQSFLEASLTDLESPTALPSMAEGVERIYSAIKKGENILVYGDYDVDGITGTVLLTDLLRRLGGKVNYYLPDRKEEGYGLNSQALVKAKESGTDLIVTVDCGISSLKETTQARELGMDLVITDHHQLPAQIPSALAVINPKLADESRPWYDLAGVGVAFKVGQAVATLFSTESICEEYLDLVALGTIADIVPLRGENRILVKAGLERINQGNCRLGIQSLMNTAGLKTGQISTGQVGFVLAPRLNACGRLGKADIAVQLLLSTDVQETDNICRGLEKENRLRQELEEKIYHEALAMIEKAGGIGEDKLILLASSNWHPGVIGIVASRLTEKYYRPTILLNLEEGRGKGSARSIPGFNLYQALEQVKPHLLTFGGHEMAAGLTLSEEKIPIVRQQLLAYAHNVLDEKSLTPVLSLDAEVTLEDINEQLIKEINLLAPYGFGNPSPLLVVRNICLKKVWRVGKNGDHLKLRVGDKSRQLEGIGFQLGEREKGIAEGDRYDLAFIPQLNTYQGITQVQMQIREFKKYLVPDVPLALYSSAQIEEKIQKVILGEAEYYEKQKEALRLLKEGQNTLLILGTGRGKSAVFQSMAAYLAIRQKKVTIIVYPLRSLVNDQYQRIREKMSSLGVRVSLVNGSMGMSKRKQFFKDLAQGDVEIILTTPEFLVFHLDKFKQIAEKIGLFVVDEAHHLAQSKRRGYYLLGQSWEQLGKPLVLAVSATADLETAQWIKNTLCCSKVVVENYVRNNLQVVDKRAEKDKLKYLLKLLDTGERIVIYVNSRKQAYQLANDLRFYYPASREEIGFYHGGLNSQQRIFLEKAFREGDLRVMVTTSAFGEGIDIPDIKHVVLYHLCFSLTEFNQLSGRAGRNNQEAKIHLLFNQQDRKLNELILEGAAPTRTVLAKFYLYLRKKGKKANPFPYNKRELQKEMQKLGMRNFCEQTVSACLGVLEDLGLLRQDGEGGQRYLYILPPPPEKLDLADSLCYLEGRDEWDEFQSFADFVLKKEKEEILRTINRPIAPDKVMSI
ncbi:MAG: single-stranded-DNA-specific exonuclease RecJ [Peptococcia bacterium]|jgi:single-stranded-DNA-specific exonuclease